MSEDEPCERCGRFGQHARWCEYRRGRAAFVAGVGVREGVMGEREFRVGDGVVYRPHLGAPAEDGVVTSVSGNPTLVFVRYRDQHPSAPGKATPVSMLTHLSDAGGRVEP